MAVALVALLSAAFSALLPTSQAAARPVPFQRGMTLAEWGPTGYAPAAVSKRLRVLKQYGVDSVTLIVVWNQRNDAATSIAPGAQTVPDRNLKAAIRSARRLRLKVVLRPYLDVDGGGWRGELAPTSRSAWFTSYRRFVMRYARLARREHARGFVIGSELKTMSRYSAFWRRLARDVRRRFPGFVAYQANWDETVNWWSAVDVISISAYFPLTESTAYTVADLVRGWARHYAALNRMRRTARRPVMFGEIGYRSIEGSAREPWDVDSQAPKSAEAQRRAYEATLRVWFHVPWFRGIHWWYMPAQDRLLHNQRGSDHRPLRPALDTLSRWYHRRR